MVCHQLQHMDAAHICNLSLSPPPLPLPLPTPPSPFPSLLLLSLSPLCLSLSRARALSLPPHTQKLHTIAPLTSVAFIQVALHIIQRDPLKPGCATEGRAPDANLLPDQKCVELCALSLDGKLGALVGATCATCAMVDAYRILSSPHICMYLWAAWCRARVRRWL